MTRLRAGRLKHTVLVTPELYDRVLRKVLVRKQVLLFIPAATVSLSPSKKPPAVLCSKSVSAMFPLI